MKLVSALIALLAALAVGGVLSSPPPPGSTSVPVQMWETSGDGVQLLAATPATGFGPAAETRGVTGLLGPPPAITVDDGTRYQRMSGFGGAMTDSSAYVLQHDLDAAARARVLASLFSTGPDGIGLDVVRVPIGASDFATGDYTEDDVASGDSDPRLEHFSLTHDLAGIIPVLRQALTLNPAIEVIASPWSAPAWMKTDDSLVGGTLRAGAIGVYARYLVRFVQLYSAHGIRISALTLGNEPDYSPPGYPGMRLSPQQEAQLARALAADLQRAGLDTRLLGFDADWSDAGYALSLLRSPGVAGVLAGTAFHCYAGDPSAQLAVHQAFPGKAIAETECTGIASYPNFGVDLVNSTRTLIIDSVRDWSSTVMFWNLVLDQSDGPQNGGCSDCVPNVTVDSATGTAAPNVEQYILGQASRFVDPGAYRIASSSPAGPLLDVAFLDPDGRHVLLVLNPDALLSRTFEIRWNGDVAPEAIPPDSVQTYVWR